MERVRVRRPPAWLWLASLGIVVGAGLAIRAFRGVPVETVMPRRTYLEQRLVASGRVMPPARVNVSATVSGLVLAVSAVEGRHVKAGEPLIQIDDADARNQVARARAALAQANARVEQLRRVGAIVASQSLTQAQTNLDKAIVDRQRAERLAAGGAATTLDVENARRNESLALSQRIAAEAQQMAAQPTGADSRLALASLLEVRTQLEGALLRLSQTRVAAPQAGTILTRAVEPGDTVQPGRSLLILAVDGDLQLVVHPDERNLALLAPGQKALASADAFPRTPFEAVVSDIAPAVDPQRGSIEVHLRVIRPPAFLRPDMTVSVDLLVGSRPNALTVPREVIRGPGPPWVMIASKGRAERREVRLGLVGEGEVEVTAGLSDDDRLIPPGARPLQRGRRVRVRPEDE